MSKKERWTKGLILQEIESLESKLKRRPVKGDNASLYFLTRKFFGSWNNAMKEAGFQIKILQKPSIPAKLDQNLAYFLGLLITDGHIVFDETHKKYKVMIFNSYGEEKEIIITLIKRLFDYNPSIRTKKTEFSKFPNHEVYICSKNLAETLIKKFGIPSGAKSRTVKIPSYLFKSNKKEIAGFIRGVIDGDGSVSVNQVKIASGSIEFLEGMRGLLKILDVNSGKICKEKNKGTWVVYISTIANLQKLYSCLYQDPEFFYPRKKKSWEKIFKSMFTPNKILA